MTVELNEDQLALKDMLEDSINALLSAAGQLQNVKDLVCNGAWPGTIPLINYQTLFSENNPIGAIETQLAKIRQAVDDGDIVMT